MNNKNGTCSFNVWLLLLSTMCLLASHTPTFGIDDMNLDDLPLPPVSTLSQTDQEKAISFFESQHNSWLAVTSGTARYQTHLRRIVDGEFIDDPNHSYSGTLEFVVTPMADPAKLQSPVRIQVRLVSDTPSLNFLHDNIFESQARLWLWADGPAPSETETNELREWAFKTELYFFPFDFMSKTYHDGLWSNKYTEPKDQFFSGRGVPWRLSTEEETEDIFGGESQYLFMLSPALIDAHYWFSAENGELRQVDVSVPRDIIISFHYENYAQEPSTGCARFPQRFVQTFRQGSGTTAVGWEYTVDLADLTLNADIPGERFVPHPTTD